MSSGNGGGDGFFEQIVNVASFDKGGNFFENIGSDILNAGVQLSTVGLLGYENGSISNGAVTNVAKNSGKGLVSGVKEVTGAKAAEEANAMARQQFEQTKAEAEQARLDAQNASARDQLRQSQMAGAARTSASSRSANRGTAIGGNLGQDERDFLGL